MHQTSVSTANVWESLIGLGRGDTGFKPLLAPVPCIFGLLPLAFIRMRDIKQLSKTFPTPAKKNEQETSLLYKLALQQMLSHKELLETEGVMILGTANLTLATLLKLPPSALFPLASCTPTLCPFPLTMDCTAVVLLTKLFSVLFGLAVIFLSGMGHRFHSIDLWPTHNSH